MKISLLKKKRATQSKAEKNFISYANVKTSKKVLQRLSSKWWAFIDVCEFFAPLNVNYLNSSNLFYCHAQLTQIIHFLLFNGDRLLYEIIHATIAFGGFSHCSWKRVKNIAQFLTALMRLRRVLSNPLWLNSCELITHRIFSLPRC